MQLAHESVQSYPPVTHAIPRVAHVITSLETGGAEIMLAKLIEGIAEHGGDSMVIYLGADGPIGTRLRERGVPTLALGFGRGWPRWRVLLSTIRLLRQWRPSIIQGWMYHGNVMALLLRLLFARSAALLWNIRCSLSNPAAFSRLTRFIVRLSTALSAVPAAIIFNSRISLEQHRRRGFRSRSSVVLANGFDLEQFVPDASRRHAARAALRIEASEVLIGLIARYDPDKDFRNFIDAVARVGAHDVAIRVVMAGPGVVEENAELLAQLRAQGLSQRVQLLGELADVAAFLPALDVLCLSSRAEAFPNVVGEAMACAVPCVTTEVGDVREIVGETGYVVEPRNSVALAQALERMISLTPAQRQALGAAARQRVSSCYDIKFVVQEYIKIYSQSAAKT